MSVEDTRSPPQVETVLTIWQDTLNEATLTVDQALACAAQMLGLVLLNCMPNEPIAHDMLEDLRVDIHGFINVNWVLSREMRKGKPPIQFWGREEPRLPGTAIDELKRMLEKAGSIDPLKTPENLEEKIYQEFAPSEANRQSQQYTLLLTPSQLQNLIAVLQGQPYVEVKSLMDLIQKQVFDNG